MSRTRANRRPPPSTKADSPAATGRWARHWRTHARVAAVSGILFAGLFVAALVLVRQAPGLGVPDRDYTAFYRGGAANVLVTVGLYLVPFAGIAFMWHMSAARTLIESVPGSPSEMPGWLQLASGVVFVCMLFAGTSAVGAVALLTVFSTTPLPSPEVARALSAAGYGMVFVFGVRAAGMFMITTTTLARKRSLLPRWVALLGHLTAAFLLVSTTFHPAILLIFPGWILLFSASLLARTRHGTPAPEPSPAASPSSRIPRRPSTTRSAFPSQRSFHEHDDRP